MNNKKYSRTELLAMHGHCTSNASDASAHADKTCGCFFCGSVFTGAFLNPDVDFTEEADGTRTVLCPYCGIDSVIVGSDAAPVTKDVLNQMHTAFFGAHTPGFDASCPVRSIENLPAEHVSCGDGCADGLSDDEAEYIRKMCSGEQEQ